MCLICHHIHLSRAEVKQPQPAVVVPARANARACPQAPFTPPPPSACCQLRAMSVAAAARRPRTRTHVRATSLAAAAARCLSRTAFTAGNASPPSLLLRRRPKSCSCANRCAAAHGRALHTLESPDCTPALMPQRAARPRIRASAPQPIMRCADASEPANLLLRSSHRQRQHNTHHRTRIWTVGQGSSYRRDATHTIIIHLRQPRNRPATGIVHGRAAPLLLSKRAAAPRGGGRQCTWQAAGSSRAGCVRVAAPACSSCTLPCWLPQPPSRPQPPAITRAAPTHAHCVAVLPVLTSMQHMRSTSTVPPCSSRMYSSVT